MKDFHIYSVGDARVARVQDCELENFKPIDLLPELSEEQRQRLERMPETLTRDGQHVLLSIHTWVIWLGGKTILIDTGAGNDKPRPFAPYFDRIKTPYLERLRSVGVSPEAVDYVLHTHLHVDHVGWNTSLVDGIWKPTFPNARHIFSAKEYAYFTEPANHTDRNRTSFQTVADSVTPVIEAGLADMIVIKGTEAIPGFTFHSTPGHTVDHASIVLESQGEQALFAGDVLHHPLQVYEPDLLSVFDPKRYPTLTSRRWALDFAADHNAAMFSSHFFVDVCGARCSRR